MKLLIFILLVNLSSVWPAYNDNDTWPGKWFPNNPNNLTPTHKHHDDFFKSTTIMGIPDSACDNAKDNLKMDFDPKNPSDSLQYICVDNKTNYFPNYAVQPIIREDTIPPVYSALHVCMNHSIEYADRIPTYGKHRPLWCRYGEYTFAPAQRWTHNLEHGAIVMLYHPCSHNGLMEKLKLLVASCLYRHIITPSIQLSPERPYALVAWGKSLEMSVVDTKIAIKFIRENALRGPEKTSRDGQYHALLESPAKIVSDEEDTVLCPDNSYEM